ncbi:hypothetical protein ACWC3Y_10715 [Streptomyces sp. NPDC001296]
MTRNIAFRPGIRPPEPGRPRLRLRDFLTGETPAAPSQTPPAAVDYESGIDFPMYGNDEVGDCGPAGCGHVVQSLTTYGQGKTATVTEATVLAFYSAISGYVPGDPSTDVGVNLQDMLEYWRKHDLGGHEIVAFAEVDVSNPAEMQLAIDLFDAVITGINLPKSAEDQFNAGQVWDVVRGSKILGGHCVPFFGYGGGLYKGVTWAAVQAMTEAFRKKYVGEGWIVITKDWLNAKGQSPTGLDLYGLGQALAAMTGDPNPIPKPQPTPTPTPVPSPPPSPTPSPTPALDPDVVQAWKSMKAWAQKNNVG